ncbi:hypothetical protein [Candidatus Viridilinea mediisalina]|uniref:Uncharacterized protein n=1 Tax=Candidatus Viridilinea mediisalina TaxID=2024553 RepID=A0A2A6RM86_9CHLR|nr:hypothetical protein [Candidatus Viridilinea mediisalina]PDW04011.1 hypothetical protein CJ255_06000 [Candidatus Viridilinea mediisalina]
MGQLRFDQRWLILVGLIIVLANASALPWQVVALSLAGVGGWLLWTAWQMAGGSSLLGRDAGHVTYWRGQRIERPPLPRQRRPTSWPSLAPILVIGLFGAALVMAGLVVFLRAFEL